MTSACSSILGHKFKPIITKAALSAFKYNVERCSEHHLEHVMDASREQTFNGVYCERCGQIKEKIK